ncbi:hypothetical protein OESDEN_20600 [Oesophagostomum dentatum]|uniref:Uncharacterized protein n=1 Tax=Oesophagostomum dentatum TaxID=61180 RepID=A0A0B1S482_OESDE|nr:hypothetical protein OESDEN_20600 [Oesophagostomum dentatum]
MSTFRLLLVFAALAATTFALKCYDGDSIHGKVKLVECPEYEFCAWFVLSLSAKTLMARGRPAAIFSLLEGTALR